ncbi:protein unc-80 homolog isoform X2 [Schistocerca piceifrons]|uniref:protein unc-80 homolog isoform X2 n=1 Tax=Schistocerca piceifrons TaxID=274613 RepID=UPI001F5FF209|nr:protein unc-80 homolog isoform X2 [Schistocerca piceifrons]
MIICFESELVTDWIRIARTIREIGQNNEGGLIFWNFLDFVVTQRTPLFILLLPFLHQKVNQPPASDQERHMQHIIREKLRGLNLPTPKGRGSLLMDLAHEMKELKEELEDNQYDDQRESRHATTVADPPVPEPATTTSRPGRSSLIADLLTGELGCSRESNNKNNNDAAGGHSLPQSQKHRGSVSSVSAGDSTTRAELNDAATAADTTSSGSHGGKTPAGETSVTPLSPGSPTEGSSGEMSSRSTDKPRLQRSKAQSRKTFRLRKSRKSRIEVSHIKIEPREIPQVPGQSPTIQMPVLELAVTGIPPAPGNQPPPQLQRLSSRLTREGSDGGKDVSWDDVSLTSSMSGYRESYSALATAIESPSPDSGRRDMPSTSSAATTHIGSPDTSANSTGGEETALLCRSDRTSSQHSLLMVFETQDEDTLI